MSQKFEKDIKKSLENFEVPYEPQAWDAISQKLDQNHKGFGSYSIVLGLLSVFLAAGVWFYFANQEEAPEKKIIVKSNNKAFTYTVLPSEKPALSFENTPQAESLPSVEIKESKDKPQERRQEPSIQESNKQEPSEQEQIQSHKSTVSAPSTLLPSKAQGSNPSQDQSLARLKREKVIDVSADFFAQSSVCQGVEVEFGAPKNLDEKATYAWKISDGTSYKIERFTHVFQTPGTYSVELTVSNKHLAKTHTRQIRVYPIPSKDIEVDFFEKDKLPVYQLNYASDDVSRILWQFEDGTSATTKTAQKSFLKAKDYQIEILVENKQGCQRQLTQTLQVEYPITLLSANAFSPNSDGVNDFWLPELLKNTQVAKGFTVEVYTKSRSLVFRSNHPDQQWDGSLLNNTRKASVGETFMWQANVQFGSFEKPVRFTGSLIITN